MEMPGNRVHQPLLLQLGAVEVLVPLRREADMWSAADRERWLERVRTAAEGLIKRAGYVLDV
jgi:hypothetical protein